MSGKMARSDLDQAFGLPEVLVAVSTSRLSCKRAGKTRTLMPVWDSSGESRLRCLHATRICYAKDTGSKNRRPLMNRKLVRPDGPSNCNLTISLATRNPRVSIWDREASCSFTLLYCSHATDIQTRYCTILMPPTFKRAIWGVPCFGLLRAAPGQTA